MGPETDILRQLRTAANRQRRLRLWRDAWVLLSILLSAPLLLLLLGGLNHLHPALKAAIWLISLAATLYLAIPVTRRHLRNRRQDPDRALLQIARQATKFHPRLLDGVDLALQRKHQAETQPTDQPTNPQPDTPTGRKPETTMLDHAIGQIFREIDPERLQTTLDQLGRQHRDQAHTLRFATFALIALAILATSSLLTPQRTTRALAIQTAPQPRQAEPTTPRPAPELTELQAILIPPAYTGWAADTLHLSPTTANPQVIDTDQPILPGTELVLTGRTNQIGAVTLHVNTDSTTTIEHPVSTTFPFHARHTLMESDTLTLQSTPGPNPIVYNQQPTDGTSPRARENSTADDISTEEITAESTARTTDETENPTQPITLTTSITPDRPPVVQWIEPATHLEADPGLARLPLRYRAHDRIGLASLTLEWELRRAFGPEPITGTTALPRPGADELEAAHTWELADLDLRPRDELRFHITARDGNDVTGPGTTQTPERILRVPSMVDALTQSSTRESSTGEELNRLQSSSETLRQRSESLQNQLRTRGEAGFQEREQLRQTESAADELGEQIQSARNELQELEDEIGNSPAFSEETREAARRVADMMEELDHPALREALEKLRQAMQEGEMNELSDALQQFSGSEAELRDRLSRTLQLFQDLKTNLQLDRLAARLDESANLLHATQPDSTTPESPDDPEDPSRAEPDAPGSQTRRNPSSVEPDPTPEEQANRDLEAETLIGDVIDELPSLGEEALDRRRNRLQTLAQAVTNELQDVRTSLSETMQQPEPSTEPPQRPELAKQTREQAERLRNARTDMQANQIQISIEGLERTFIWTLLLSSQQEILAQRAPGLRQGHDEFASLARTQQRIRQQTSDLGSELNSLTEPIPPLSLEIDRLLQQTRRALGASLTTLAQRNPVESEPATRTALASLNQLADLQQEAIRQLRNQAAGGAGLSMEQLADQLMNLTGEQLEINRELQELINEEQGERLTMGEQERLDQLAREQNRVLEELERLRESAPRDERQSELEQTLREMEESIRRLREGRPESVPDRQADIHARMLRTQDALRQQGDPDEDEPREARRAEPSVRPLPTTDATPPERSWESELRLRLADPRQTPFAPDVQELMERYIDQLRELE